MLFKDAKTLLTSLVVYRGKTYVLDELVIWPNKQEREISCSALLTDPETRHMLRVPLRDVKAKGKEENREKF